MTYEDHMDWFCDHGLFIKLTTVSPHHAIWQTHSGHRWEATGSTRNVMVQMLMRKIKNEMWRIIDNA